ncbi:XRE family transcriptional regulator [Anaerostipes hadrus]|jgi:hypothetical protein|uniref:XRE family transcriptional regulator n=1 Tax=Anaerostipes hadrus TaxID=649756 RepID=UPI0015710375|nr:XRE family transcriptional regulator [Anaerostipes hadrus]NSG75587.1 XRE family transcriptional regulator [Anaerostipes hadrus]
MYPNVEAEKARTKTTLAIMASDPRINCTVSTLSLKLNGKAPLTFKEAVTIKNILKSDLPLEELFEEAR